MGFNSAFKGLICCGIRTYDSRIEDSSRL